MSEYRDAPKPLPVDRSVLVVGLNGRVFGMSRTSGEILWENGLEGGGYGEVALAIGYGVVIASASGRMVFCLDYLTGKTRWEQTTSAHGRASIVIEPDIIICSKNGYTDAFDPRGTMLWSQPLSGKGTGSIALGFPGNVIQADDAGTR
jgi:outer membrane protein assembly factor BamB